MSNRLPRRTVGRALAALALASAAIGGYLIGSSPDRDVEAARVTAAANGFEAGARRGMREGYAVGFEPARNRAYASAYSAAYREAYAKEFESAGLDPPERIRVPEHR